LQYIFYPYAITLFGDKNTKNVVLEKSYKEYMEGFTDITTGDARRGYLDVVAESTTISKSIS
jgi:type I restriction enzyme R subunit